LNADALLSIRYLDLTNQSIGDRGLDTLARLLERETFAELDFDGSSATSLEVLCRFCDRVVDSHLKFANFPAADFAKFERVVNLRASDSQICERRDRLIRLFDEKFEKPFKGLERVRHILTVIQRLTIGQARAQPLAINRKLCRSESDLAESTGWADLTRIAPEIEGLYRDCIGDIEGHPIVDLVSSVTASLTLDTLLSEIA
jgi:hypothetical protein